MRKMKIHKLLACFFTGAGLLLSSCSDIAENESGSPQAQKQSQTIVKIALADENASERTVLPTFNKTDLSDIKLYGLDSTSGASLSASDSCKLAEWDSYASLAQDEGIILNEYEIPITGTWSFLLTASSNSSQMKSSVISTSIVSGTTTTLAFTLEPDSSATKGNVKILLSDLENFDVAGVKYYWAGSQASDENSATALTIDTNSLGEKTALFEKTEVSKGSYFVTFYFYDDKGNLILKPWQTAVIVQAGALSHKELTFESLLGTTYPVELKTVMVTYNFNNGTTEDNSYTEIYYPTSTLQGTYTASTQASSLYTGKAPEGKRFRGWNTQADGKGTRYSPGDSPSFSKDTSLYAIWASYDSENSVYTISSADDFWAFFCYSDTGSATYGSSSYNVKLLEDVTNLEDWISPIFYGTFDGNSKSLSYTLSSSNSSYYALFADFGGSVKNLTLTGLSFSTSATYVAGLAALAENATVTGVTLESSSIKSTSSSAYVGGLIAKATSVTSYGNTILGKATSKITISGSSASYVGGLFGYSEKGNHGTSANPDKVQFAEITGSSSSSYGKGAGGFAGFTKDTAISYATVAYSKVSGYYAGGLTGYADATSAGSSSYPITKPTIETSGDYPVTGYYAGGIAGFSALYISNPVVKTATVSSSTSGAYIGGIAGKNTGTIIMTGTGDNLATVSVNGASYAKYSGGVAGHNSGSISGIIVDKNTTVSSSNTDSYLGGIAGWNDTNGKINKCSFAGSVTNNSSSSYYDTYTGGVAGYNKGSVGSSSGTITVSGSVSKSTSSASSSYGYVAGGVACNEGSVNYVKLDSAKVDGSKVKYAGGIVAYNAGTISSSNAVTSVTLTGNSSGNYGYVIGKNNGGSVSEEITNSFSSTTTKSEVEVDGSSYYALTLTRTSKVSLSVTDSSGGGKLDGEIRKGSSTWSETSGDYIILISNVDSATETKSAGYLEAGTYYVILHENYVLGKGKGSVSWTVD